MGTLWEYERLQFQLLQLEGVCYHECKLESKLPCHSCEIMDEIEAIQDMLDELWSSDYELEEYEDNDCVFIDFF